MWLIASLSQLEPPPSPAQLQRFHVFIPGDTEHSKSNSSLHAASKQLLLVFLEYAPAQAASILLRNPLVNLPSPLLSGTDRCL